METGNRKKLQRNKKKIKRKTLNYLRTRTDYGKCLFSLNAYVIAEAIEKVMTNSYSLKWDE